MTSVADAVLVRHSTRAFLDRPVAAELVYEIIGVARHAPSGGNLQPWKLAVMAGDDLKRLKAAVRLSLMQNPKGEGPEHPIYPHPLQEPYDSRRRKCGEDLYGSIGIGRDNKPGRLMQFARNFDFFGAPVGVIVAMERGLQPAQWTDVGIFLQSLLLLAHERGLATCAQAAWAAMHRTVRAHLGWPDEQTVVCGISLGYADPAHPINTLVTDRAPLSDIVELRGFAATQAVQQNG
jgi:nitroreductase